MTTIVIFGLILAFAAFAIYRWGRKSYENKVLKQDVKTGEKVNDVLKEQRDNQIDSVEKADDFWDKQK